ncbi:MAG: hypothetical protein ACP5NC_02265 [Nitrososphaeria archaeon]
MTRNRAGHRRADFLLSKRDANTLYASFEDPRLMNLGYNEIREVVRTYIELYGREPTFCSWTKSVGWVLAKAGNGPNCSTVLIAWD